jgi:hypothetical protein
VSELFIKELTKILKFNKIITAFGGQVHHFGTSIQNYKFKSKKPTSQYHLFYLHV